MGKVNYNGYVYTTKRDALTGGQVSNLVSEAIKISCFGFASTGDLSQSTTISLP